MTFLRFNRYAGIVGFAFLIVASSTIQSLATRGVRQNIKMEKVEPNSQLDHVIKESDGNWFVMAKKFSGDNAAIQAKRLVYELRVAFKMQAFIFKYDPDKVEMDVLSVQLGKNKKFHCQSSRPVKYAVLVGGFPTSGDLELQKTLKTIRKIQPKSLRNDPQSKSIVEKFKISARTDPQYADYGPLGNAIPVPNPLLPPEFFNHKGIVDPFIAKLNSDSKYSLLNNPQTYTVRIATFSGDSNMKKNDESFDSLETRLQYAGFRAAALCEALRNDGVEAWEFHDRDCSFVTVGSFAQYGTLQQDGHTELIPQVAEIMNKYGGTLVDDGDGRSRYRAYTIVVQIPDPKSSALVPKKKTLQLACDLRPVIIVVPQRSGEENVKKIALAKQQMDKAREKIVKNAVERSLAVAEDDLETARKFASTNSQALSEEEYITWASKIASQIKTPQIASMKESYSNKAVQSSHMKTNDESSKYKPSPVSPNKVKGEMGNTKNKSHTSSQDTKEEIADVVTPKARTTQRIVAPTY